MNLPKTFEQAVQNYREALKQAAEAAGILAELEARVAAYKALIFGEGAKSYWQAGGSTIPNTTKAPPAAPTRTQNENVRTQKGNRSTAPKKSRPAAKGNGGLEGITYGTVAYIHEKEMVSKKGSTFTKFGIKLDVGTGDDNGWWANTLNADLAGKAHTLKEQGVIAAVSWKDTGYGPDVVSIEPAGQGDELNPPAQGDDDIPF